MTMPALYDQLFLFGDSITEGSYSQERGFGFGAALQAAYARRLDVVNRGFSGYNTRQALQILPTIVPVPEEAKIRILTVFFGANDASLPTAPNKQHIPLHEYKSNLEKIVTHPQVVAHRARIVLVAPPPLNEHLWWPRDQSNGYSSVTRVASVTKQYADAVCEVGEKLNLPVLNLWQAFMERVDVHAQAHNVTGAVVGSSDVPQSKVLAELMYDGLHLSPAGYEILYQEFMRLIATKWPDQTPPNLPWVFPPWNDENAWKIWSSSHTPLS